MITEKRIEELSQSEFADLTSAELRECCKVLGIQIGPRTSDETMRRELNSVFGTVKEEPKNDIKAKAKTGKPNLTSDGEWGGRKRTVIISRNDETKKDKGIMLGWENMKKYYAFGKEVHLPYPLWEVLKNAVGATSTERERQDEEGVIRTERTWEAQQKHPFSDLGDTPGTEHLPTDMIDYYRGLAKKLNNFAGLERRKLNTIMADFHGKERAAWLMKDEKSGKLKEDAEVLHMILTHLGLLGADDDDIDIAA